MKPFDEMKPYERMRANRILAGLCVLCAERPPRLDRLTCLECGNRNAAEVRAIRKTKPPEWRTWETMIKRCYSPVTNDYELYGGAGITVCVEWRHNFEAFFAYIGPKPTPKHSIDRINSKGNYEPGNVRWATALEQNANRSNSRRLTVNGETATLQEWSLRTGLPYQCIYGRLKRGWSPEKAISPRSSDRE